MTGEDFITIAGNLVANPHLGDSEARFRSAVSRAYYGAFHLAVAFLAELGKSVKENHEGHAEAYRALFNTQQTDAVDAARLLNDLRTMRNEADYKLHKSRYRSMANAKSDVEAAVEFCGCLSRCQAEPVRTHLRQALQNPS